VGKGAQKLLIKKAEAVVMRSLGCEVNKLVKKLLLSVSLMAALANGEMLHCPMLH
jgi:hypothetical protein